MWRSGTVRTWCVALAGGLLFASCGTADMPPPGEAGSHPLQASIWDVAAGQRIDADELRARLGAADIVVLGEIHDNPVHHGRQAWAIEALAPGGVAFEMVPEASERGIAVFRADGAEAGEIGPAIGWNRLGWPDWSIYEPVFVAAGDAYIAGGGVSRSELQTAIRQGAAVAYGPDAAGAGLSDDLPPVVQTAAEAEMIAAHCDMLPAEAAPGMVEAQRLRDARFARAAVRAHQTAPGAAVLVTGNGHARTDRGAPAYIARLAPDLSVVSVGQVEVRAGAERLADYAEDGQLPPYDYVWFSEGVDGRPDPCEAFRR